MRIPVSVPAAERGDLFRRRPVRQRPP